MTRDEQEMTLWRAAILFAAPNLALSDATAYADSTVAEFRKRYPPAQPLATPSAAWYDEPPFNNRNEIHYAWVQGNASPCMIAFGAGEWIFKETGYASWSLLSGRRVSPISAKPLELTL